MDQDLRKLSVGEEFDYNFAMSALAQYKNPRVKLHYLMKKGEVIRVKKGLYVFGGSLARKPFSKEILANLIYGPSYISLSYALAYYDLIPERVETVTSITNKRKKLFKTSVGNFSYQYINPRLYHQGITRFALDEKRYFLIATKEKALCDFLYFYGKLSEEEDIKYFILDNLRIDARALKTFKKREVQSLAKLYNHQNVYLFESLLRKL